MHAYIHNPNRCIQCPYGKFSDKLADYANNMLVCKQASLASELCQVCKPYQKCPGGSRILDADIKISWRCVVLPCLKSHQKFFLTRNGFFVMRSIWSNWRLQISGGLPTVLCAILR